jgi:hypothetical protein
MVFMTDLDSTKNLNISFVGPGHGELQGNVEKFTALLFLRVSN